MILFAESLFLSFVCGLYWVCGDRRRYLKKRVGKQAFRNTYRVARNVFFMLKRDDLELSGNTGALKGGCILYSFHFGVWELMPRALRKLGFRIGVIVNRYHGENSSFLARYVDSLLKRWRSVNGIKVFYGENVLEIVRFIKSGGIFGVLVDGNTLFQKHEKARRLAQLCEVPLISFAAYRLGSRGVLKIDCNLIGMVQSMPLDYMWFYKSR